MRQPANNSTAIELFHQTVLFFFVCECVYIIALMIFFALGTNVMVKHFL